MRPLGGLYSPASASPMYISKLVLFTEYHKIFLIRQLSVSPTHKKIRSEVRNSLIPEYRAMTW